MFKIEQTAVFTRWYDRLRDHEGRRRIDDRIGDLRDGLFSDAKSVGGGVLELRIHSAPDYRVYFTRRGAMLILLLCGGDKGSQRRDIERAKRIAADR